MLANQGQACSVVAMLVPGAKANTAAATSAWLSVAAYEGDIMITAEVGTVTAGTVTWTVEDATDDSGTGGAAVTLNEGAFTVVTTSNDPLTEKRTVSANKLRAYFRLVGTIATGPADASAVLHAHPKYVG